jgi:hypothetical protein
MKKILSFTLIIFLLLATFMSCREKYRVPPVLISSETMQIDFDNFILTAAVPINSFGVKGTDDANWKTASEIVSPWRTLTAVTLSVPFTAYKTAVSYNASHLSGNKWEWSYNAIVAGVTYKVRLIGGISGSQVKWEMYVSRDGSGGFTEFKWIDGTSNTNGTEGKWTFYENHTSQTALLQIDWTKSGTKIEKIKYTYLKAGTSKDAYIEYGPASEGYDFFYKAHYYNETFGRFSDADIKWVHNKEGRIKSNDYLDTNWQCWDDQKMNAACN